VDEIELCKLWNNVQSLTASVESLIALVNKMLSGRRKKRLAIDTTTASITAAAMSLLEEQVLAAMADASAAIGACLAFRCNPVRLGQLSVQIADLTGQVAAQTTISSAFQAAYQDARRNMDILDMTAASGPLNMPKGSGVPVVTPVVGLTAAATPSLTTTTSLCCWQFNYLPLNECIAMCQANGFLG
jgi:hypothetical protein